MTPFERFLVGRTGLTFEELLVKHESKSLAQVSHILQVFLNAYTSQFDGALLYPTADLYDRYTIELLKNERANANNQEHINVLFAEIKRRGIGFSFLSELYTVNGQIWDLESEIRNGVELGYLEVGRRAIEIRNLNAKRIMAKNDVSKHFNEFNEYKYNHASKVDPDVE